MVSTTVLLTVVLSSFALIAGAFYALVGVLGRRIDDVGLRVDRMEARLGNVESELAGVKAGVAVLECASSTDVGLTVVARGYRGVMARYGRRRKQQRGGFGFWGPFPSYSRRTRGGGSVRVTGCCLPLALTMAAVPAVGARAVVKRLR